MPGYMYLHMRVENIGPALLPHGQVYLVRGNHEFRDMSENMGELGFLRGAQIF